jgi:Ribbon-helix-helix protein, copG family
LLRYHLHLYTQNVPFHLDTNIMIQPTQQVISSNTRTMSLKQLNVKIPEQELRILEAFAEKTERTKTDIIREFIRSLQTKI